MKINHFLLTTKFEIKVEHIGSDYVYNSETYYFESEYKHAMKAWILIVLNQYITDRTQDLICYYADVYVEKGIIFFNSKYIMDVGFYQFMLSELFIVERLISNRDLTGELIAKAQRYEGYLKENEKRFRDLDTLTRMTSFNNGNRSLMELAQKMIENPLIDLISLDEAQKDLFGYLDRSYLFMLLYPTSYESYIEVEFELYKEFNFGYYKNPPIYSGFSKKKKTYLKFLKSWLLESIESRKKMLEWDILPDAYQNLMAYVNDLLPVAETIKYPELIEPLKMLTTSEVIEVKEFPAHIFKTFEAYMLFQTFMQVYKTPVQISFLYRIMAEIEKPQLIFVRDTPFREWFNRENYPIKLYEHTSTFNNANNKERWDAYKIVKNLIFNKS
jgi:hypothetical protein